MVILDQLLAEDQSVVDVEVDQTAGGFVEAKMALDTGDGTRLRRQHRDEPMGFEHAAEARVMVGVDQKVEIGLTPQGRRKVLVALPMDIGDPLLVEGGKERSHDRKLI